MSSAIHEHVTVTRDHISRAITRNTGIGIGKSSVIVDQIINILVAALMSSRIVKINKFGSFSTRRKEARVGRNPKTMVPATIPARRVVKFKIAPTLKKMINSISHDLIT